jgi:hypothetical protein
MTTEQDLQPIYFKGKIRFRTKKLQVRNAIPLFLQVNQPLITDINSNTLSQKLQIYKETIERRTVVSLSSIAHPK